MSLRPRFDLLEKWHVVQSTGHWESEPTAPDSDAQLGDGDSISAIYGHAHGAQILEAQDAAEAAHFWKRSKPATACPVVCGGQFQVQSFPQTAFEKVK